MRWRCIRCKTLGRAVFDVRRVKQFVQWNVDSIRVAKIMVPIRISETLRIYKRDYFVGL